jgi:SAM-dependent methyltransferase/uncharacterized protein YbaR (Trm112 family)
MVAPATASTRSPSAVRPGGLAASWQTALDSARGLLACPRCGGELVGQACPAPASCSWICDLCDLEYPVLGGVPWLFADPSAARAAWRNRHDHARARIEADRKRVMEVLRADRTPADAESGQATINSATRTRLERLAAGQSAYLAEIDAILEPVLGCGGAPLESHAALRTALPAAQGLLTYESNVFRDWCWGAAENAAALEEVRALLPPGARHRILVLGSGAGRLAYDLHQASAAELTVALDINPLLACVGHRVSRGETLELTEFPLAPRSPGDVAVARSLLAPAPARPGLVFVLGDALQAPFVAGAFDVVVTPWLLDILEVPADLLVARINRLLAPGGAWINHGSVGFCHADPAERLTADELLERVRVRGFAVAATREREVPYLCCPESRHRRLEQVLTFRADRLAECPLPPYRALLPDWIVDGSLPIPATPAFRSQAVATRTHAYIMSLIDGARSLNDVAAVLARHQLIDAASGREALRGFFATMHQEATRSRSL